MFSSIHYNEEKQLAQRVDKINAHLKNNEKKNHYKIAYTSNPKFHNSQNS